MTFTRRHILLASVVLASLLHATAAWAVVWVGTGGNWSSDGSPGWNGAGVPNTAGAVADISQVNITANQIITLDGADPTHYTIGTLLIGDSATTSLKWTIQSAAGTTNGLIFDNGGNNAVLTQIATSNGDTISAPVLLTSSLDITNATANNTSKTLLLSGKISANSTGLKTITNKGTTNPAVHLSGTIENGTAGGTIAVVQNGTGSLLQLSGANTFTGGVTVQAGTLRLNNAAALGPGTLTLAGGAIDSNIANLVVSANNAQTWSGNFTFTGTQNLDLGTGAVLLTGNRQITLGAKVLTVGGVIGDGGNNYSLSTASTSNGTLVLNGANTYTGGTLINGGVVQFNAGALPATGLITTSGLGAVAAIGQYADVTNWLASGKIATTSTGAIALMSTSNLAENIALGAYANLSLGAGSDLTYTGTLTPAGSTYRLGGGVGILTLSNTNALTGSNGLAVNGKVTLAAANDFTGATSVSGSSILRLTDANAVGASSKITVANGGRVELAGNLSFNGSLTISGSGGNNLGALESASTSNTWAGNVTLGADATRFGTLTSGNSLTISGVIDSGTYAFGPAIRTSSQNDVVTFSGVNTYLGGSLGTQVVIGILKIGIDNSLPPWAPLSIGNNAANGSSATFDLNGHNQRVNGLQTTGGNVTQVTMLTNSIGAATLTIDNSAADYTFGNTASDTITGDLSIIKTGTRTQTIACAATFTGSTTVNGGTLTLDYAASGNPQDNSKLADGATLILGGGTLNLSGGTHSEAVAATTIAAGGSRVTRASGTATLQMRTITRDPGGVVDFGAAGIATTDTLNTNGILGGWATVAGTDWATNSTNAAGGPITALPAGSYTALATSGSDTNNALLTGAATLTGNLTTNTLKINTTTTGESLDLGVGNTLALTGGGLLFVGANDYAINNGTLQGAAGGDLVIHQAGAGVLTIGAVIADNGGPARLVKSGAGKVVLAAANSYTGPTSVYGGTLSIGGNDRLGAPATGAALALSNGTLEATATFGLFNGTAGVNNRAITLAGAANTIDVTDSNTLTVAGVISGAANLSKAGTGTLMLANTAPNTYTGTTTISAGTLQVGDGGTNGGLGSGSVVNNGGLILNRSDALAVPNAISGTGTLTQAGGGATTLAATSTFTGDTVVSGGTLVLAHAAALSGSTLNYDSQGGTLSFDALTAATLGGLKGGQNLTLTNTASAGVALTVGGNNQSTTYTGVLSGAGSLTKNGTGTWTLPAAHSYTGGTTLNGGVVAINTLADGGSPSGVGASTSDAANLVLNGARLVVNAAAPQTTNRALTLGTGGGTIEAAGATSADTLTFSNTAALTLTGTNAARTLTLRGVNTGLNTFAPAIGDNGTGKTSLIKDDVGTWVLPHANSYSGTTTIKEGSLVLGSDSAFGTSNLVFGISSQVHTVGLQSVDATPRTFTNAITTLFGSNLTLQLGSTAGPTGDLTFTSGFSLAGGPSTRNFAVDNTTATFSGAISGQSGINLFKLGNGTLVFSNLNTYQGPTTIKAGTLTVHTLADGGGNSGIGASSNAATNLVIDGGTLQFAGVSAQSTDRLFTVGTAGATLDASGTTAANTITFSNPGAAAFSAVDAPATVTLTGTNTGDNTLATLLADNGTGKTALVKNGLGAWVVTNANTYTGNTSVNEGTLQVTAGINANNTGTGTTTVGTASTTATLITEHVRQDTLTINAGSKTQITGATTSVVNFLQIANGAGGFTWNAGSGGTVPAGATGGSGNAAAVPEPAAWLLAVMAVLAGLFVWRRCRSEWVRC